ncbi:MAG: potassium transporter KtrB [Lachnospiraceae bacterium]|nr:potassium transporter KtrB [Lachnospiraceae bacterium]
MKIKKEVRSGSFSTVRIVSMGFLGIILMGSLLLWLPISNREPIAYLDALFTATSAICVTGLVTIVPATQFTLFGKVILLILIQIGGLGVIACTMIIFKLISKKVTIKGRIVIQQAYNLNTLTGMMTFILRIIKITFVIQLIGALFFAIDFIPRFGWTRGIGMSIYHAVSAFCNADLNLMGPDNFEPFVGSPLINFTVMALIVMGGLGFTVWSDLFDNSKEIIRRKAPFCRLFSRLSLQSKMVLSMSGILIVLGALGFFLLEMNNEATMGGLKAGETVMASFFQSVTSRSGGFVTVAQDRLTNGSKVWSSVLMFIGGSPGSTAGGVKTTTFAMMIMTTISVLRGRAQVECFGRRIAPTVVKTGITITFLYFMLLLTSITVITILEPAKDFLSIWFEGTSALGTVGLSTGITQTLSRASQGVLMVLMYVGRIGPVTAALVFVGKAHRGEQMRELPEKYIMIG